MVYKNGETPEDSKPSEFASAQGKDFEYQDGMKIILFSAINKKRLAEFSIASQNPTTVLSSLIESNKGKKRYYINDKYTDFFTQQILRGLSKNLTNEIYENDIHLTIDPLLSKEFEEELKDYLKKGTSFGISLAYYEEQLYELDDLREEIRKQIRNGEVDDYASKELGQIRNQIAKSEEEMKRRAEQIMRANKECMADNFCTYRNGRLCVPVKKDCKFKISGSTIDKSSTGNTLFVEPTSVARYYEEIQLLKIDEENEIYRILYTLSAMVAESAFELNENVAMIEKLDFIFSKGKLSFELDRPNRYPFNLF